MKDCNVHHMTTGGVCRDCGTPWSAMTANQHEDAVRVATPPTPDPRERGEDGEFTALPYWEKAKRLGLPGDIVPALNAACDELFRLRAPAPSEAVAWLIEKPQPGGVYWWHGKRHALAAINEDYNPDHFPSAIAYEFGPIAAEAVRFNSREDADVVIRRFPPQWRSVLIASEHMWVSAHPAPARGVTVTEAMVERAMGVECGSTHHEHHPPDCRRCWQAKLTAALTPDAEGGA